MFTILSVITSIKDYIEIVHQLIDAESNNLVNRYDEFGPLFTYIVLSIKNCFENLINFNWIKSLSNLPIIVPDISSSMISEISIVNGSLNNTLNFAEIPESYGEKTILISSLEKFFIGLINSLFLWVPTSTAQIITLRKFIMQGLDAGYIAGLGALTGSIFWISCIIFGCRFFIIPWLSLDIFRYILGFILLILHFWGIKKERRLSLKDLSKQKIFLLNFLLALTEQTSIYPFLTNISIAPEASILESFPANNYSEFLTIHGSYIIGLTIGGLSLLHFTCWFIESYAFQIYMWMIASFKFTTGVYYKTVHCIFLYLTMICAISSVPYYAYDYTLTSPFGFVSNDRLFEQKDVFRELSFINSSASEKNTRRNTGRHGRRERWKRRFRKYRMFDVSFYDEGTYELFSIEDLNYGFDRFWTRRKIRNHRVRFKFFPAPLMRAFKKELARTRLESYSSARQEFFRMAFEQFYDPRFHEYYKKKARQTDYKTKFSQNNLANFKFLQKQNPASFFKSDDKFTKKAEQAISRKFLRKFDTRIKQAKIIQANQTNIYKKLFFLNRNKTTFKQPIYSKRWKHIFSNLAHTSIQDSFINCQINALLNNFYKTKNNKKIYYPKNDLISKQILFISQLGSLKKNTSQENLSKKELQILSYRSILTNKNATLNNNNFSLSQKNIDFLVAEPAKSNLNQALDKNNYLAINHFNTNGLLHPMKFYLQRQKAFERKLRYYTPTIFRKFSVGNNASYFRIMLKRAFYYYKPTLRWERTVKLATLRKARRKQQRKHKTLDNNYNNSFNLPNYYNNQSNDYTPINDYQQINQFQSKNRIQQSNYQYSTLGKRATRYRAQINTDLLQHWYYSPLNRILLKFDIDLFIQRQPKTQILNKNEKSLLVIRRFLVNQYYNSLRWYTSMQHYLSMKTKIGTTKSFASQTYSQQGKGTFKKIRHLFAITPSQTPESLKFDALLFNEADYTSPLHEELFNSTSNECYFDCLTNQNRKELLHPFKATTAQPTLLKVKGLLITQPETTRPMDLLIPIAVNKAEKLEFVQPKHFDNSILQKFTLKQELTSNLLKRWKNKIANKGSLKNYLLLRIQKRDKTKNKKRNSMLSNLSKLENLFSYESKDINRFLNNILSESEQNDKDFQNFYPKNKILLDSNLTSGIYKAIDEGSLYLQNQNPKTSLSNIKIKQLQKPAVSKDKLLISTMQKQENYIQNYLNTLTPIITTKENQKHPQTKPNLTKNNTQPHYLYYPPMFTKQNKHSKQKILNIFKVFKALGKNSKNYRKTERLLEKMKRVRKRLRKPKTLTKIKADLPNPEPQANFAAEPYKRPNLNNYLLAALRRNTETPLLGPVTLKGPPSSPKETPKSRKKRKHQLLSEIILNLKNFKKQRRVLGKIRTGIFRGVIKDINFSNILIFELGNLKKFTTQDFNQPHLYPLALEKIQEKYSFTRKESFLEEKHFLYSEKTPQKNKVFLPSGVKNRQVKIRRYWKKTFFLHHIDIARKYRKRIRFFSNKEKSLTKNFKEIQDKSNLPMEWFTLFFTNFRSTTDSHFFNTKQQQFSTNFAYKPFAFIPTNQNFFQKQNQMIKPSTKMPNNFMVNTTTLPFYAGWDESLRKFIVTNRFLSRRESGYSFRINPDLATAGRPFNLFINPAKTQDSLFDSTHFPALSQAFLQDSSNQNKFNSPLVEFKLAPLKGMNAATTMYWQIPFTTYDPDQFFALGTDTFAPINWRKFKFRHTILKTWIYKTQTSSLQKSSPIFLNQKTLVKNSNSINSYHNINKNLIAKIKEKTYLSENNFANSFNKNFGFVTQLNFKNTQNNARRLIKRYKRVKKHPRTPTWFPSGPLVNHVLPIHYLSVFFKRNRMPRDRYLKRLLNPAFTKSNKPKNVQRNFIYQNFTKSNISDFTLRKRVKTQRKYHRIRTLNSILEILPKRLKFLGKNLGSLRWRPFSLRMLNIDKQKNKSLQEIIEDQLKLLRLKNKISKESKFKKSGRQDYLRRRVSRVTVRSPLRYIPRTGGLLWPGDYFKVELINVPKLETEASFQKDLTSMEIKPNAKTSKNVLQPRKIQRKKRRQITKWQSQPKTYCLEKHNIKVLKTKLKKSYRSNKLKEKIQERSLHSFSAQAG